MKEELLTFEGRLDIESYESRLYLKNEEGAEWIDLTNEFLKIGDQYPDKQIQVSYWASPERHTKDEMKERVLMRLMFGELYAYYDEDTVCYSTWTGCDTTYSQELQVGGHNLYKELYDLDGDYVVIEIAIRDSV